MDAVAESSDESLLQQIQTTSSAENKLRNLESGGQPPKESNEDDEDVPLDVTGGNRGDEGVLEGVAIKETADEIISDDEEEDNGFVISAGRHSGMATRRQNFYERAPRTYIRPVQFQSPTAITGGSSVGIDGRAQEEVTYSAKDEEMKLLRFTNHRTAFDVDLNLIENPPWRHKFADISDYFNYGFTEKTWQNYCREQLQIRAKLGLGPQHASAKVVAPLSSSVAVMPPKFIPSMPTNVELLQKLHTQQFQLSQPPLMPLIQNMSPFPQPLLPSASSVPHAVPPPPPVPSQLLNLPPPPAPMPPPQPRLAQEVPQGHPAGAPLFFPGAPALSGGGFMPNIHAPMPLAMGYSQFFSAAPAPVFVPPMPSSPMHGGRAPAGADDISGLDMNSSRSEGRGGGRDSGGVGSATTDKTRRGGELAEPRRDWETTRGGGREADRPPQRVGRDAEATDRIGGDSRENKGGSRGSEGRDTAGRRHDDSGDRGRERVSRKRSRSKDRNRDREDRDTRDRRRR